MPGDGLVKFPVKLRKIPCSERLSCWSSGLPWVLVSQDSVEDGEEFSHASGDGECGWLTSGAQALISFAEAKLVAQAGHDRHEERGPHGAAAAGDGSTASQAT